MRASFLFLLLGFACTLQAQMKLGVFLNIDNCFKCESDLRELKALDKTIKVELHIIKEHEYLLAEYLARFNLSVSDYSIVKHDKLKFDPKHHNNSFYRVYLNRRAVDTFYGEELALYIKGLNAVHVFLSETGRSLDLPDSNVYSQAVKAGVNGNFINFSDFKLGKSVTYQIMDTGKMVPVKKLQAADLDYRSFFALGSMDTTFYHTHPKQVEKRGTLSVIDQTFIDETCEYYLLTVPYYYMRTANILRNDSRLFLARYERDTRQLRFFYIKHISFTHDSTVYFLDNSKSFYVREGKVYLPLYTSKHLSDSSVFFLRTKFDGDTLLPNGVENSKISTKEAMKRGLDDDISLVNTDYISYIYSRLVYNYRNNSLEKQLSRIKMRGHLLDVEESGAFVSLISLDSRGKLYLNVYNKLTARMVFVKKLEFSEEVHPLTAKLFQGRIVVLNKSGSKLISPFGFL